MLLALITLLSTPVWPDSVPVLYLEFDQDQWDYACENFYEDIYLPVQLTNSNISYQCQFRIRGATSRSYPKKSIKIEMAEGEYIFGADELNLNAEFLDRTKLREALSYLYYAQSGQTVPGVHLVEVVFNGETQGGYLSVEDIDKDFLLNTALPENGVIYKCSDRFTTLDRIDDLGPYYKKTHESQPFDDLLLLIYWLHLCPEDIFREQLMERFYYQDLISAVATNVLIGHGSTYYHNYFLLLDEPGGEGKWRYLTWDMDRTWGKYGPEFPYSRNSCNDGTRRNTLIWRMWCNETIREELFEEMKRQYPLVLSFAQGNTIDSLADLVAPLVEADPFRDYEMNGFWAEVASLSQWPEARYVNVLDQIAHWPLPFSIREPEYSSGDLPVVWQNAGNLCTWRLEVSSDSLFQNPDDLVYKAFPTDTFHTIPAQFTGSDLWMHVYATRTGIEHRSDNGPIVPTGNVQHATFGNLVINEINYMSSSLFNPGDWFEVINTDDKTISLNGWSIRDKNRENLTTLNELSIYPGQCLVFSSDSMLFISAFQTTLPPSQSLSFNLSDNGELLRLIDPIGNTVDSVSFMPELPWPLPAAGYGPTLALLHTSLPNHSPQSWTDGIFGGSPFLPEIRDSSMPRHGAVTFSFTGPVPVYGDLSMTLVAIAPALTKISMYDTSGRMVLPQIVSELTAGESTVALETSGLPSGVYFVGVKNMGYLQTRKITVLNSQ